MYFRNEADLLETMQSPLLEQLSCLWIVEVPWLQQDRVCAWSLTGTSVFHDSMVRCNSTGEVLILCPCLDVCAFWMLKDTNDFPVI